MCTIGTTMFSTSKPYGGRQKVDTEPFKALSVSLSRSTVGGLVCTLVCIPQSKGAVGTSRCVKISTLQIANMLDS